MSPNKWGGSLGGGGAGAGGGMGGGKGIPLESTLGFSSGFLSFLDSSNSRPKSVKSRSQILRGRSKLVTISSHLAWPSLQKKKERERGCVTDLFPKIPQHIVMSN